MKTLRRLLDLFTSTAPTRDVPFTTDLETAERLTPRWPRPQQQWLVYAAPEFPPESAPRPASEPERVDAAHDLAP